MGCRVALQYIREIAPPLEALISQHSLDFELAHALLTLYHLLPQARQTWKWEPLLDLLVHKVGG